MDYRTLWFCDVRSWKTAALKHLHRQLGRKIHLKAHAALPFWCKQNWIKKTNRIILEKIKAAVNKVRQWTDGKWNKSSTKVKSNHDKMTKLTTVSDVWLIQRLLTAVLFVLFTQKKWSRNMSVLLQQESSHKQMHW